MTVSVVIAREKRLKRWHRAWKIGLVERQNPDWSDLATALALEPLPVRLRPDGC